MKNASLPPPPESLTVDSGSSPAVSGLTTGFSTEPTVESDANSKPRGRPIGTTIQARVDRKKLRADCINDITKCYAEELERM